MTDLTWWAIGPQIWLVIVAAIMIIVEVTLRPPFKAMMMLAGAGLLGAVSGLVLQFIRHNEQVTLGIPREVAFNAMILRDGTGVVANMVLLIVLVLGVGMAYPMLERVGERSVETLALMFLGSAGFMFLGSSANLIMAFIGLEVGSISLYVLAGMARKSRLADEAAMKYFLLGSFASAIFIYGVSLLYAGTGSVSVVALAQAFPPNPETGSSALILQPGVLYLSMALLLVGLLFKVTAAPFHAWAPDVYQGAPAGVAGFMAASAKVGGFVMLLRIVEFTFPRFDSDLKPALAGIAALSIVLGTLLALSQTDLRRMLAYSGVAHAGFLLVGVSAGALAHPEIMFYLTVYTIQLVTAFGVAAMVSGPTSSGSPFTAYAGLARRSPIMAGALAIAMLGMSGMPITSGFWGKLGVFQKAWAAGYEWLVVLGLVASVAAFFFYLRVIVNMYMRPDDDESAEVDEEPHVVGRLVLSLAAVITILLGVYPAPLLDLIVDVVLA